MFAYAATLNVNSLVLVVTVPPLSLHITRFVCVVSDPIRPGGSYCRVVTAPAFWMVGVTEAPSKKYCIVFVLTWVEMSFKSTVTAASGDTPVWLATGEEESNDVV